MKKRCLDIVECISVGENAFLVVLGAVELVKDNKVLKTLAAGEYCMQCCTCWIIVVNVLSINRSPWQIT